MKKFVCCLILFACTSIHAGNLIEVHLNSYSDAELLNKLNFVKILHVDNDVLVFIDDIQQINDSNLRYKIIQNDVDIEELALTSPPHPDIDFPADYLYKNDNLYIVRKKATDFQKQYSRLKQFNVESVKPVQYINPSGVSQVSITPEIELDSLISLIEEDSLNSYLHRLEAFTHRLTGTDSSYASRDWIENKFRSFGYDSVVIDPFIGSQLWDRVPVQSYNVIAYKIGTKFPEKQIIIGGHFDAVPDCPGADDNGTGTSAVLELARVFKDIETEMTFIFIAFDSEESWMWGSYHYADSAYARGDDIVLMVNPDMIGHITNSNLANLYYGEVDGYARLWSDLSDSLVGISGVLRGSTASDHLPFQENGYDVIFVQENIFSTNYHQPSDSTTYINFDYMTRMTKGIAATVYTVDQIPPPIANIKIIYPGDGQSLILNWERLDISNITEYHAFYYPTDDTSFIDSVIVPSTDTSVLINGLEENREYSFYVKAFNNEFETSLVYKIITGLPSSIPASPTSFIANPQQNKIELVWSSQNLELDFSHFEIYRDSTFLIAVIDTFYTDDDVTLGAEFHEYNIYSVDTDSIYSLPNESTTITSRAATLTPDRILAINRSHNAANNFVDEVETGLFMRDALSVYNFDYYSDSSYHNAPEVNKLNLFSFLDYGIIVIGAESGLYDDIALPHYDGGLSEILSYYSSIGGNILVFGRWSFYSEREIERLYSASSAPFYSFYTDYAGLQARFGHSTQIINGTEFSAEMIGAKSQHIAYPNLSWDSILVQQHTLPFSAPYGIPFASYAQLDNDPQIDVLYTFDAANDNPEYEDKPVAWIRRLDNSKIIMIDIPLSFMNQSQAALTIQTAVDELLEIATDVESDPLTTPVNFTLSQNYPNPFNPATTINFSVPYRTHVKIDIFNIIGQKVTSLTDEVYSAGNHTIQWDGENEQGIGVSTGIYLYRLQADDLELSKKMLLLR